jgi:transcriptional regulator of acetoin/glycerol metabolism
MAHESTREEAQVRREEKKKKSDNGHLIDDSDPSSRVRPLQELEREMMVAALKETQGNVSEAARRLGIGRATFYRRAQRYGLTREDGFPG